MADQERRGFAAMDPEQQREIARKGGEAVSQNREHMAAIGRKGGQASHGGGRERNPENDNENGGRGNNRRNTQNRNGANENNRNAAEGNEGSRT